MSESNGVWIAMMSYIAFYLLVNLFTAGVVSQSVELSSTLFDGNVAYDGQRVNFTCITTSTDNIITWRSDNYISDILQLTSFDGAGYTNPDPTIPGSVATLISATTNGGITVIESQLRIIASMQYPMSSVRCQNDGHGPVNTTTFRTLLALPSTSDSESTSGVTTSEPVEDPEAKTDAKILVIPAVAVVVCVGFIIVIVLLLGGITLIKKCTREQDKSQPQDECSIANAVIEPSLSNNEQTENCEIALKGLVYAEVGQSLLRQQKTNKQSCFLNLDDGRIEYAQLKHQPESHTDKQLEKSEQLAENISNGRVSKKHGNDVIPEKPVRAKVLIHNMPQFGFEQTPSSKKSSPDSSDQLSLA